MTHQTKRPQRRKAQRQIITFIICIFLVGAIIGGFIVAAANTRSSGSSERYGTRDGRYITEKGGTTFSYEMAAGFEPLECDLPVELQEFTYYLCEAYYLDFEFVMAVMYTESKFEPDIVSGTNDSGLMQINKCNHAELSAALGITDFTEPYQNIRGGLYILRRLFEKYDSPARVCMAYNMGEYGASVLWDKGVYETSYSIKVLTKAAEYKAASEGKK